MMSQVKICGQIVFLPDRIVSGRNKSDDFFYNEKEKKQSHTVLKIVYAKTILCNLFTAISRVDSCSSLTAFLQPLHVHE